MAVECMSANDGVYAVDWEILMRICRSHVRASSTFNRAQRVILEDHLIGPTLYGINVDWDAVRRDVDRDSVGVYNELRRVSESSMSQAAHLTTQMVEETRYYKNKFAELQRVVTHQSMVNINDSVHSLELTVDVLKVVRDFSAEFLLVSAGAVSGGAALAAVGAGSLLKGGAKWEDSGNFASGLATASTELLFAAIPIKVRGTGVVTEQTVKLVLAFAKIPSEMYKSVVEGKPVLNGVISGTLKFQDPVILELAKQYVKETAPEKLKMAAVAVVAAVKLVKGYGIQQVQRAVAGSTGNAGSASRPSVRMPAALEVPRVQSNLADAATFEKSCVTEYAICRM